MEVEVRQDQHGIMEVEAAFGGEGGKIKKIIPIGDSPMSLYFAHVVAWQRENPGKQFTMWIHRKILKRMKEEL